MVAACWSPPAVAVAAPTADLLPISRGLVARVVAVAALLIVAWVAYLLITGLAADRSLHRAQSSLVQLRHDLTGSGTTAQQLAGEQAALQHDAKQAAGDTDGPFWSVAAHLPGIGRSVTSVRGATDIVADLSTRAVPGVVALRSALVSGATQHGAFPTGALKSAAGPLDTAADDVAAARVRAARLSADTGYGGLDRAVSQLQQQLAGFSGQLSTAAQVATIAPSMLGGSGSRSYFVAFENEAETRGVGGLPGAFAILTATNGKLSLTNYESDSALVGVGSGIALPADYQAEYGAADPAAAYLNSDISPNFPDAARIWMGMWQAKTGQRLDGAIALDPTALSELLSVTGSAALPDGTRVDNNNVVALTERDAYTRFGSDNDARRAFLLAVARAASTRIQTVGPQHPQALATTLARLAGERRVLLYSNRPAEETVLDSQPIAGLLAPTTGPGAVSSPYLMVDLVNAAGNKVDYYVHESVSWAAGGCSATTRASTVTVRLTNDAPPGLPPYAGRRQDSESGDGSADGSDRLLVTVRPTAGSTLGTVTLDGRAAGAGQYSEQGRPAYVADVEIQPGASRTLVFHLAEPTVAGTPMLVPQPLVKPEVGQMSVPTCPPRDVPSVAGPPAAWVSRVSQDRRQRPRTLAPGVENEMSRVEAEASGALETKQDVSGRRPPGPSPVRTPLAHLRGLRMSSLICGRHQGHCAACAGRSSSRTAHDPGPC